MAKNIGVKFAIGAAMSTTVASAFATVDSKIKSLKANIKELNTVSARAATLMTADSRPQDTRRQYTANPTEKQAKALASAERAYKSAERSAKKYNITTADAAKVHARATEAIKTTQMALERQEQFQANAAKRRELRGQIMGTVASVVAAGAPIKVAADYDKLMSDVRNATKFTAAEFEKFKKEAMELPALYAGSYEDVAAIAVAGGHANFEGDLKEFTVTGQKMVAAWKMNAVDAGEALAGIRTSFKLSQVQAEGMLDTVNHLSNNMAHGNAASIIQFTHRMADVAQNYEMNREQVMALGATWAALDVPAKKAETATKAIFDSLGQASKQGKDAQAAFRGLGLSGQELEKSFKIDPTGTMEKFMLAVGRAKDPMRVLTDIFGEGQAAEMIKLVNGIEKYQDALGLTADEAKKAGSFQREFKTSTDNAPNSIVLLKNKARELGVAMGTNTLPAVRAVAGAGWRVLDMAVALVDTFPTVTSAVMAVVVGLAGLKVAALAGKYAALALSDGWLIAKGVFNALRPSVLMNTVALQTQRVVSLALAAGTRIMAVAQWALNAAMTANPIGIVVVAVAALAAGMVWLYRNCEPVRTTINAVWSVIKTVGTNMLKVLFLPMAMTWNAIKAVWGPVSAWFGGIWTGIKTFAVATWDAITGVASAAVTGITSFFSPVADMFSAVWEGVKAPAVAVFNWIGDKFEWVAGKLEWIRNGWKTVSGWFGGDDEETLKPVTELTAFAEPTVVAVQTAVSGVSTASVPASGTVVPHMVSSAPPGASATISAANHTPAPPARLSRPSVQAPNIILQPSFSFPINMEGVSSRDVGELLVKAIQSKEPAIISQFSKLLERLMSDQRRLAYDT